jgi:hypothetical protein
MMDRTAAGLLVAGSSISFLGTNAATWARIGWLLALTSLIYLTFLLWRFARGDRFLPAAVAAAALTTGQIIGVQLVLGWLGMLTPLAVSLTSLGFTLLLLCVAVIPRRGAIGLALREVRASVRKISLPAWAWLLVALYAGILLRNVFYGWFLPPYDRDGLAYHLPIMASLFQAHSVAPIPSLSVWVRSYPINGELVQLWSFLPLGVDKLVDLAFLPGIVLGALSLYGIARHFGATRAASLAGAAVFAFTPTVFLRQVGSYNDAWLISIFFMGVFLLLKSRLDDSARTAEAALLCGLCAGIVGGTKYSGLALAAMLALLLIARLAQSRTIAALGSVHEDPSGVAWRRMLIGLSVFIVMALFLGAYAYLRNWIVEGNPLAPAQIAFGSRVVWPGLAMDKILALEPDSPVTGLSWAARVAAAWFDRLGSLYDYNFGGSGPLWVFLGLPGLVYWLVVSFRRRALWPLLLILGALLVFAVTPDNWRPRFALALFLPMSVGAAMLVDRLASWPGVLVKAGSILAAGYVLLATLPPAEISIPQLRDFVVRGDDRARSSALVAQSAEAYRWVEQQTRDRPMSIAYGRRVDIYPLFGADLRNTILHLHAPDESSWQTALEASPAELVVTSLGSKEDEWTRTSAYFVEVERAEPLIIYARR